MRFSLSRSAFGHMWPRSKPVVKKSDAWTRYQLGGIAGSGRNVSTRPRLPYHALSRCQLTQFGVPLLRLYDSAYVGFSMRKLSDMVTSATAPVGLPMVR